MCLYTSKFPTNDNSKQKKIFFLWTAKALQQGSSFPTADTVWEGVLALDIGEPERFQRK